LNKNSDKKLSKNTNDINTSYNNNIQSKLLENISKSIKLDLSSDDNKLINSLISEKQSLYNSWIVRFVDIFSYVKFEYVHAKLDSILLHSW